MAGIQIKILCLLVVLFGIIFEKSDAGITQICSCNYSSDRCPAGESKQGQCTLGGKVTQCCYILFFNYQIASCFVNVKFRE